MQEKKIFNPNGSDLISDRTIIKGNGTNLFNMNEVKYKWANDLFVRMTANFWLPERISLVKDKKDYLEKLNDKERDMFCCVLSFLTFLDSIQTNNIPKVADFITASEVTACLSTQSFFETIHSKSYSYIIENVIDSTERNKVYEYWKQNDILFERNKYIANIYQEFWDNQSDENFAKVIIANYILESLYFYNGFMFFYNFVSRGLLFGVADEIRLIQADELLHIELFANIINEINKEFPDFIKSEVIYEMFDFACKEEIKWFSYVLKDSQITGMSIKNTEEYTKYLVNQRLTLLGLEPLYINNNHNPYHYLEAQSDSNSDSSVKSNFFESKNTNYVQAGLFKDWDKI